MNRLQRIIERTPTILLDIRNIKNTILYKMGLRDNNDYATAHLEICQACPYSRQLTRSVDSNGSCWWQDNWQEGNTNIPRHFGILNSLRYYSDSEPKLDKFAKLTVGET
tara:strand:+ start:1032 stop:1358 length:327 start_codon:yes stop_codon:yes gene_type:complete